MSPSGAVVTGAGRGLGRQIAGLLIEVNALGTINGTVAAIEAMRPGGGHIVNDAVPSMGLRALPFMVAQGRRAQRRLRAKLRP